jgi:HlyD family secretion protein
VSEPAPKSPRADVARTLGLGAPARRRRNTRVALWVGLVAALGVVTLWLTGREPAPATAFVTAEAEVGDLAVTVTATGRLEALDTVEVGSEVSGRVDEVRVDFNDRVHAGQVLAVIDPEQAKAREREAHATLLAARASLARAQATDLEAQQNLQRVRRLEPQGVASEQEVEAAQATAARAKAEVAAAKAQLAVAEATLADARTALEKTEIRAPIDGLVLSRQVEPGQTVAATFQTPVLFTLARDLTHMELLVDVDEADVGKVREGQPAHFTVEAYPNREFDSRVLSLRNVPKEEQNVVTYQAVLAVDNQERLLRPGMTATARILTDERHDVLLVPNAALRFTPPAVALAEREHRGGLWWLGVGRRPEPEREKRERSRSQEPGGASGAQGRAEETVWVLRDGAPRRVPVVVGPSDGVRTQVLEGELEAGDPVIVDFGAAAG